MQVFDLGLVEFKQAWKLQKEIFDDIKAGKLELALILCRHYPVITLGRLAKKDNILVLQAELVAKGIGVYEIERGGDVTYHGPGQITAYPIFKLSYFNKDIHLFLRYLEESVICTLSDLGVKASRRPGFTGVWVEDKKIASIGISVKNWIAYHGLSLNVEKDDLVNFRLIRPCGMDIEMTSLETILGRCIDSEAVKQRLLKNLEESLVF